MMRILPLACLGATLCMASALAQAPTESANPDADNKAASKSPVAWVYVSSSIGDSDKSEIHAFNAASDGKLTPIAGSPFDDSVGWLAVNGKYLFGSATGGTYIDSYMMESNGALSYSASTDVLKSNSGCGSAAQIFLDHTGANLYNFDYFASDCSNNTYQSFVISKGAGKLTFMNDAGSDEELNGYLTILADNKFAYSSDCYHFGAAIYGFKRNSGGSLTMLNINPAYPTPPKGVSGWCPYLAKADTSNHVAIPMFPSNGFGDQNGPYQLATYTADSSGNLTTTSKSTDMPAVEVGAVNTLSTAPSGELLAVGGANGLQVFHFNGAGPIMKYTGLLTSDSINQVFWDNNNHLYAISQPSNKLWVFNVTRTSHNQATGSPYSINSPLGIAVQPLPRYESSAHN
jgi:hypothetical protein